MFFIKHVAFFLEIFSERGMKMSFTINEIRGKKPWLAHYPHDVCYTEKGLREGLDDGYRVFINKRKEPYKFEVHNLNNIGTSLCMTFDKLDGRVIKKLRQTFVAYHGDDIDEMDAYNKMIDEEKEKQNRKRMEDASLDSAGPLIRAKEIDELHQGYKHTHVMPKIKKAVKDNDRSGNKGSSTT
jgi:hypothetical protein